MMTLAYKQRATPILADIVFDDMQITDPLITPRTHDV
jgi:hypothetical protein